MDTYVASYALSGFKRLGKWDLAELSGFERLGNSDSASFPVKSRGWLRPGRSNRVYLGLNMIRL